MDSTTKIEAKLPDNAHRELKEGEVYKPVMSASSLFPEITL